MADGSVIIDTKLDSSGLKQGLNGLGGIASKGFKAISVGAMAAGAGLIALGTYSAKIGQQFESSLAQVGTIMDTDAMSFGDMSNGILALSGEMGVAASDIAQTAYAAISATGDTAGALDIVKNASMLATAGFTDTNSALSVLTTAMNAYGYSASDLTGISDSLIATQNLGVTTVAELAAVMGKAIATGSAYNVGIHNLESAYVSLTKNGINTAESTTYISAMLNELGDSSSDVGKIIKNKTGKSFGQLMADGNSLGDVLSILNDSVDGNAEALMGLWGSAEAGKASNAIVSQGLETFSENLELIEGSAGATADAYETMSDTLGYKTGILKTNAQNLGIAVYEGIGGSLSEAASFGIDALDQLNTAMKKEGFSGLAKALGNVLSQAVTKIAKFAPKLVQMGISLIKSLITGLTENVDTIAEAATSIITQLLTGIMDVLPVLATAGLDIILGLVDGIISSLPELIPAAIQMIAKLATGLVNAIPELIAKLPEIIQAIWEGLLAVDWIELGKQILDSIVTSLSNIGSTILGWFSGGLSGAKDLSWGSIGTAIKNAIGGIGDWFGGLFDLEGIKGLSWSEIGTSIKTGVGTVLDAGGTFLSGLFTAGKNAIEGFSWSEVGTAVLGGVTQILDIGGAFLAGGFEAGKKAIEGIDWATLGTTIGDTFNGLVDTAGAFLSGGFTAAEATIKAIDWTALGTTIGTAFNDLVDTTGTFLSGGFELAKTTITTIDWAGIGTTISSAFNGVVDTTGAFISGGFTLAETAITTIDWAGIGTTISGTFNGLVDTTGAFISGGFEAAETTIKGIDWAGIGTAISDNLNGAISAISAIGTSFWSMIEGWFTSDEESEAEGLGKDLSDDLADGMTAESQLQAVQVAAETLATTALNSLKLELGGTEGGTSTTTDAFGEAAAIGISDGITAKATEGTYKTGANSLATAAANAMNSAFGVAGTGFLALGTKAASKFNYIGEAVAQGIANGISNNTSVITTAARSAATAAYNAAKKKLEIQSPSKLFGELGMYCAKGLAGGLVDSEQVLNEAMGSVADRLASTSIADKMTSTVTGRTRGIAGRYGHLSSAETRSANAGETLDYDALGKAVWNNAPNIHIDLDGEKVGTLIEPKVSERQEQRTQALMRRHGDGTRI